MASNTGKKLYATLVQIYTDTGLPTGNSKENSPTDSDYIAPYIDLESCPVNVNFVEVINNIQIKFKNLTSQSVYFTNVNIVASGLSSSDSYFISDGLGILPGDETDSEIKTQLSDLVNINLTLLRASQNARVLMTVYYKKQTDYDYSIKNSSYVNIGDSIALQLVNIPRETDGSNLNQIMIEFS